MGLQIVSQKSSLLPVPRVLFDGWSGHDYHALLSDEDAIEDCVSVIVWFVEVSVSWQVYVS